MPLPSLEQAVPQFEIEIPSTKQRVKFRQFFVKEEKLLLLAMEEEDERKILDAVSQVISSCAITPLRIEDLANFDLEYIFLQLRARSVDAMVKLHYKCINKIELSVEEAMEQAKKKQLSISPLKRKEITPETVETLVPCGHVVTLDINLDDVDVKFQEGHTKQIFLTDTLGVNMRYPNVKMAKQMIREKTTTKNETVNDALATIAMSVESVFDENAIYNNFSQKEMQAWIESLTQPQFQKIQAFFETMPKLSHDVTFKCPKCGYSEDLHLEGLATFFG